MTCPLYAKLFRLVEQLGMQIVTALWLGFILFDFDAMCVGIRILSNALPWWFSFYESMWVSVGPRCRLQDKLKTCPPLIPTIKTVPRQLIKNVLRQERDHCIG